eukprot:gnl/TRDRNA2_/TRDRNA2_122912_c0_seq2.p1 gnl/TRDRNA2_/TRDRNA2_122912_c0~~gnl/TRDRNA2_/TRDRNA2_122912_c0_seq2.p1  ORF type:complete len:288 (+),score=55.43 gnl/TRDRNA2_/TRDRNA2_122912_c0_seq2:1-864(+)
MSQYMGRKRYRRLKRECKHLKANGDVMSQYMAKMMAEQMGVCKFEGQSDDDQDDSKPVGAKTCSRKCIEKSSGNRVCPEGHACDCHRGTKKSSAAKFFSVLAALPTTEAGLLIGGAVAGPAGATAGTVIGLAIMPASMLLAAATSFKWFPDCMCWALKCSYDEEADACAMEAKDSAAAGSNPFWRHPPSGMACSPMGDKKVCQLRKCTVKEMTESPPDGKEHLKIRGMVGKYAQSIYNCASTGSVPPTSLASSDTIPDASGDGFVQNTASARAALLSAYISDSEPAS